LLATLPIVKLFNRVLSDYPAARERLRAHAGKSIGAQVGPVTTQMRVTAAGEMEITGSGAGGGVNVAPDVAFQIPLSLLPALLRGDENAFSAVAFSGDSELASTLSTIARNVEWDVEEDLSKVVGDTVAHRVIGTAKAGRVWQRDAGERLTENVAEYLTEERRAFITKNELEVLARSNESLRDAIARLEARIANLPHSGSSAR
jgi:ubiquinone biosynthesis accessory factor UbiJ